MNVNLLLGVLGMLGILLAFILDEFVDKFNQDTLHYNLLNICGAGLLLYYAITLRAWPFIILNLVWLGTAMIKLASLLKKSSK